MCFFQTRPTFVGDKALWDSAEEQLTQALNKFGHPWKLNPGDGAFYGPKIDITLCDAYGREHQCGTIQLDFNLPYRFNLQYRTGDEAKDSDGKDEKTAVKDTHFENSQRSSECSDHSHHTLKHGFQRPVLIHRAIYGSFERFIAVVTEINGGKWPFWLSPRQIIILPISTDKHLEYAESVYNRLKLVKTFLNRSSLVLFFDSLGRI